MLKDKGDEIMSAKVAYLIKSIGLADREQLSFVPVKPGEKHRVNIMALGDVGGTLLLGLKLMGGDVISSIGIFDLNPNMTRRYEMEMNQIAFPDRACLPKVEIIEESELFNCDVFCFCASKGVPPVGVSGIDVRMAQFEANKAIAEYYGKKAAAANFKGLFAVISDPVDLLCKAVYLASGLAPSQVQGYGLGVMNARALYFAGRDERFSDFLKEGRVYGPHGQGLVVANSLNDYDHEKSEQLTELVLNANLHVRDLGFKPYIAPAISSGAISIILTMRGQWHYGSLFLGKGDKGAFFGCKNRFTDKGALPEDIDIPLQLFKRLEKAYVYLTEVL